MIKNTIESCIREFDYCKYGMHSLHELDEYPEDFRWPGDLAQVIADAVREELDVAMKNVMDARFNGIEG